MINGLTGICVRTKRREKGTALLVRGMNGIILHQNCILFFTALVFLYFFFFLFFIIIIIKIIRLHVRFYLILSLLFFSLLFFFFSPFVFHYHLCHCIERQIKQIGRVLHIVDCQEQPFLRDD